MGARVHVIEVRYKYCLLSLVLSRYIVCKGFRANSQPVIDYMKAINRDLLVYSSSVSEMDVNHIVPLEMLQDDDAFFAYMYNSNVKWVCDFVVILLSLFPVGWKCFVFYVSVCGCACVSVCAGK